MNRYNIVLVDGNISSHVGKQAPGAIPNGTVVEKIHTEPRDSHRDGSRAKVAGSVGPVDDPLAPDRYGYFVEWDDLPGHHVFIGGHRIRPVSKEGGAEGA